MRQRVGAAVRFDEADHHVEALPLQLVRVLEHLVGLAHARRGADVHAQPRAALFLGAGEQRLGDRPLRVGHAASVYFFIGESAHRARGSARAR